MRRLIDEGLMFFVAIIIALLLSSCSLISKPEQKIFDAAFKWRQDCDNHDRDGVALQEALSRWEKRESALLGQLTDEEVKAYAELKETIQGDDQAKTVLACRRLLSLLKNKPSQISRVRELLNDRAALNSQVLAFNDEGEKLLRRRENIKAILNVYYQAETERRQAYADQQQQWDQWQESYRQQRNQQRNWNSLINELRLIGGAIQNR